MPQGPLRANVATNPSNVSVPLTTDPNGNLYVGSGSQAHYNITAATVVKATPGRLVRINVLVAGAAGTANDCATTGSAAVGNEIAVIPAAVGTYVLDHPCAAGIVIAPGAAQVVSVSFD